MRILRLCYRVAMDAFYRFNANDGWAIASHIALSALMALFPFLIVVTALAGFFGTKELADEVARILLEAWPTQVATPIAAEIHNVLTTARGDVLTVGVVLAIYFASSGIESLRIGLNRAYGVTEQRSWWLLRLESIAYVLVARGRAAGAGVPDRAGAADLRHRGALCCRGSTPLAADAQLPAVRGRRHRAHRRAGHRAQMAAGRPAAAGRDRARHRRDAGAVAGGGRGVRPLSRRTSPTPTSPITPASPRR